MGGYSDKIINWLINILFEHGMCPEWVYSSLSWLKGFIDSPNWGYVFLFFFIYYCLLEIGYKVADRIIQRLDNHFDRLDEIKKILQYSRTTQVMQESIDSVTRRQDEIIKILRHDD